MIAILKRGCLWNISKMTFDFKPFVKKVYNKSRSHFMEYHESINLVYVVETKTGNILQICSIDDLKNEIKDKEKDV